MSYDVWTGPPRCQSGRPFSFHGFTRAPHRAIIRAHETRHYLLRPHSGRLLSPRHAAVGLRIVRGAASHVRAICKLHSRVARRQHVDTGASLPDVPRICRRRNQIRPSDRRAGFLHRSTAHADRRRQSGAAGIRTKRAASRDAWPHGRPAHSDGIATADTVPNRLQPLRGSDRLPLTARGRLPGRPLPCQRFRVTQMSWKKISMPPPSGMCSRISMSWNIRRAKAGGWNVVYPRLPSAAPSRTTMSPAS